MNEKQQQLLFDKGITNVPSDALCSDNTLEESLGMIYEDGEHRVIQKPVEANLDGLTLDTGETLLYVHTYNGVTRLIIKYEKTENNDTVHCVGYRRLQGASLIANPIDITTFDGGKVLVESIGNTLIVSTSAGLNYLLWDYTSITYKNLGNKIPDIKVTFGLDEPTTINYPENYIRVSGMLDGKMYYDTHGTGDDECGFEIKDGQYENLKTAMIGLASSRLNNVKEKGRFAFPFWARYAIRMYDGSHINISNPFLLMPTVRNNWWIYMSKDDGTEFDCVTGDWDKANYKPFCCKLFYRIDLNGATLRDWEDIINGIDIFVSDEVKNYEMEGQWEVLNTADPNDPLHSSTVVLADACHPKYIYKQNTPAYVSQTPTTFRTYFRPTLRSDNDIVEDLIAKSQFYKILELDMDDLTETGLIDASSKLSGNVLKNLTTQTQLEYDDYFGRTNIVPQVMKTYNHRLHMANITRDFFGGFARFSYTEYETSAGGTTEEIYVFIRSDSGEKIVKVVDTHVPEIADIWFYYPDPRAYKVEIYQGDDTLVKSLSLKEHPYLHGAYYFKRLPVLNETQNTTFQTEPTVNNTPELLEDQLVVSEVDNPYIFTAKGYTNVGMGTIIGLASQTMSLGENEHGIHPILVFTEKGISLLRLNNEGIYIRSDEASREVAIKDNPCIIETDGPVYFASERGLMVALGSQGGIQARCVSEQLSGKDAYFTGEIDLGNFVDYLKTAFIAYDYRDSLLWIFNKLTITGQTPKRYCYVYSIKSGTFGKYDFGIENNIPNEVTTAVNYYPDYLLQIGNKVYSLLQRPNINKDGTTTGGVFTPNKYNGMMTSRPLKLENALALKSIMQIKHIHDINDNATLTFKLYASNDLKHWVELTSLRGVPWKYYRFRYDFTNLIATDRFAGTMLITQERRINKLR